MPSRSDTPSLPEDLLPDTASLPPPPIDDREARASAHRDLLAVKREMQILTQRLMTAEATDVQVITKDLQRLRVSAMVLREIAEDVSDPNTYRELSLLNKMLTGIDPEEESRKKEQARGDEDAARRMASAGIVTPEQAHGLVRVLQTLSHLMEVPPDGDPDTPAPGPRLS